MVEFEMTPEKREEMKTMTSKVNEFGRKCQKMMPRGVRLRDRRY